MKVIIIDDEPKARSLLRILIEEHCTNSVQVNEAGDVFSGIEMIRQKRPDIVFLDIEMSGYSGLEILDFIESDINNFELIFTTAYNEYAIQAFQLSAIDYLLKPLSPGRVKQVLNKAISFLGKSEPFSRLEELKNNLYASGFKKIGVPVLDGIKFIDFDDISIMEEKGIYTKIITNSKGEIKAHKTLKHFVNLLKDVPVFYKPHSSYLINLTAVKRYVNRNSEYIVMDNGRTIPISKEKKDAFMAILNNI